MRQPIILGIFSQLALAFESPTLGKSGDIISPE